MASRYGRNKRRADRARIAQLEDEKRQLGQEVSRFSGMLATAREDGASDLLKFRYLDQTIAELRAHIYQAFEPELAKVAQRLLDSRLRGPYHDQFRFRAITDPATMSVTVVEGSIPALHYRVHVENFLMGKRGPKRSEGKRDIRGKLSRKKADVTARLSGNLDQTERETLRIGVEARQRLYGISPEALRDSKCETFVGRLRLAGEISERQWQAAENFHRDYRLMCAARDVPKQMGAVNLARSSHGVALAEDIEKSVAAATRWHDLIKTVQSRQNELRGSGALVSALWECVLNDRQFPHMVSWLREALTALADHYRLPVEQEKAA